MYYVSMGIFFANKGIGSNMTSFSCMFLYGVDVAKKLQPLIMVCYVAACLLMMLYNVLILGYLGTNVMCIYMIVANVLIGLGSIRLIKK